MKKITNEKDLFNLVSLIQNNPSEINNILTSINDDSFDPTAEAVKYRIKRIELQRSDDEKKYEQKKANLTEYISNLRASIIQSAFNMGTENDNFENTIKSSKEIYEKYKNYKNQLNEIEDLRLAIDSSTKMINCLSTYKLNK